VLLSGVDTRQLIVETATGSAHPGSDRNPTQGPDIHRWRHVSANCTARLTEKIGVW